MDSEMGYFDSVIERLTSGKAGKKKKSFALGLIRGSDTIPSLMENIAKELGDKPKDHLYSIGNKVRKATLEYKEDGNLEKLPYYTGVTLGTLGSMYTSVGTTVLSFSNWFDKRVKNRLKK